MQELWLTVTVIISSEARVTAVCFFVADEVRSRGAPLELNIALM